jgi:hypothetical protein
MLDAAAIAATLRPTGQMLAGHMQCATPAKPTTHYFPVAFAPLLLQPVGCDYQIFRNSQHPNSRDAGSHHALSSMYNPKLPHFHCCCSLQDATIRSSAIHRHANSRDASR